MNEFTDTPDPDQTQDLSDTTLQAGTTDTEEQDLEQFVGDELTPEEEAALEQAETGPEGGPDQGGPGGAGIDQIPGEGGPGFSGTEGAPTGGIGKDGKRWHLAPCLVRLLSEVDRRWRRRDRSGDRTIAAAAGRDHSSNARRSVNALDIGKDGVTVMVIVNAAKRHTSTNYIIFNGVIWMRSRKFRPFTLKGGSDRYTTRVHISILQSRMAEENRDGWGIGSWSMKP